MSGTITALKYQARNHERVNIYLDDKFAFALPAIEAARLRKGLYLNDSDIARLQAVDAEAKAYNDAIRFLSYRPRSEQEIRRYLHEREVAADQIGRVIARLQQAGYVDDQTFARYWVENREQFRPRSIALLRQELRQKGVSEADIRQALGNVDQEASAYTLATSQARRWSHLNEVSFHTKVCNLLARRGFDYATARRVARQLWQENGRPSEMESRDE